MHAAQPSHTILGVFSACALNFKVPSNHDEHALNSIKGILSMRLIAHAEHVLNLF